MGTGKTCQHCGKPIDPQAVGGLCPECMLKVGLGSGLSAEERSTHAVDAPDLAQIAAKFPELEILELLGKGGMGAVYKARQRSLERLVALKILFPQPGVDAGFAERFTREARALARLGHPNIVALHEFGQIDGLHYFIMEYVDGASLRQIEQSGKLTARQALELIPQICEALQFAHDEGVVHRDIKPENVLLDRKGRVKIADFGLAKILGRDPQELRLTGIKDVMGTPHYMAPEQIERPAEVDHRADIYSLGVVFYEMLTGELPLGKFAPPSRKVQVDVRLDQVVLHALEKEPELRYQQASQVKTDVEQIAVERQGGAAQSHGLAKPFGRAVRIAGMAFAVVFGLAALVMTLMPRQHQAAVPSTIPPSAVNPAPTEQNAGSAPNLDAPVPARPPYPPPVVISTVPASGSSEVDPSLTELRATFSTTMQDGSWSWTMLDQKHFPQLTGPPRLLDDRRTCVLPVKLEPGKVYATWLNSEKFEGFRDVAGRPAVPYLLVFQTRN